MGLFAFLPRVRLQNPQMSNYSFKINLGVCTVPAVSDDRSCVRGVAGFDPAKEVEEGGGILWHTVIWPGCKLELTHLSPFTAATLIRETSKKKKK